MTYLRPGILLVASCVSAFLGYGATLSAAQSPTDTNATSVLAKQLLDLEKNFADAEKRHDRDFVKNALTEDFLSISTNGETHSKAEILSDVSDDARLEYRIYNAQVVPVNDRAAVVTYDVIVRMVHYDEDTPRYQRVSSVWVKQGSEWKLKFQQATATEQRH
jgi:hypothetical protein